MKLIHMDIFIIVILLFVVIGLINSDELLYDNKTLNKMTVDPIINKEQLRVQNFEIILSSNNNIGNLESSSLSTSSMSKISNAFGLEEEDASTTTTIEANQNPKTSSIRSSVLKIPLAFIQMLAFSMGLLCLLIP